MGNFSKNYNFIFIVSIKSRVGRFSGFFIGRTYRASKLDNLLRVIYIGIDRLRDGVYNLLQTLVYFFSMPDTENNDIVAFNIKNYPIIAYSESVRSN